MSYNTAYLAGPLYFAGKGAGKMWFYDDTAVAATVIASGYISDGFFRGMEPGDLVVFREFASLSAKSTPVISLHYVTVCTDAEDTTLSAAYGSSSGLTVPVVSSTGTPGAGDDVGDGYLLGSLWVETDVDEIYGNVDTTSGAAIWYPLTDHFMLTYSGVSFATPSNGMQIPVPVPAKLVRADVCVANGGTALNATATLVMSRNATAITGGTVVIVNAATGGQTASTSPSAGNLFAAGDVLNVAVSTTQTITKSGNFVAYFKRAAS